MAATTTPRNLHLAEEHDGEDEMVNGNGNGSNDLSRDLEIDDTIKDPIEDRLTLAERNERLHDQLKVGNNAIGSLFGFAAGTRLGSRINASTLLDATLDARQKTILPSNAGVIDSQIRYAARVCVLSSPSGGACLRAAAAYKYRSARFVVSF